MKTEKNEATNWYIAVTHWLTSGFVIPLIIGAIIYVPLTTFLGLDDLLLAAIAMIIYPLSLFLGV